MLMDVLPGYRGTILGLHISESAWYTDTESTEDAPSCQGNANMCAAHCLHIMPITRNTVYSSLH